ncbi:MAG: hypothetical protein L6422_02750 [Candidatus Marinimicrobia bacterium]|nr:hypothetical protein [Candidatus Neomarinimicrobiota bacterium]
MNKKILAIAIVLAIIAGTFLASAVDPGAYTLTVTSTQNTALTAIDTSFGTVLAGNTTTIDPTFNATNAGNVEATVKVRFVVNGSVYGFNGTTSNILGTNVSMQHDSLGWQALLATDADTILTGPIAADNASDNFGIKVNVPAGKAAEAYVATIAVTFS